MIKFFRKIRQDLLSEGKIAKYLKYAVGEILLVVLGILIALQVNNWNEGRKTGQQETRLLLELKQDLIETRNDLFTDIEKTKQLIHTTNDLYKAASEGQITESSPYQLPTAYLLETAILFPKRSAYQAIQSEGVTIISNDDLRQKITNLYELDLQRIASAESYLEKLTREELKPFLQSHALPGSSCKDCKDLYDLYRDQEAILTNAYLIRHADEGFIHMLKERFVVMNTLNKRYQDFSRSIDEILFLIDQKTGSIDD